MSTEQHTYPRKINLTYMDQLSFLQGFHRSGWPFVMSQLYNLHDVTATVLFDTYVDRTFHWLKPAVVPYQQPWIGIVHHTFDTKFSTNNCTKLLSDQNFLLSLPHCKGLYVFTNQLQLRWKAELTKLGHSGIPVERLYHPTEFVSTTWSVDKFTTGSKYLVQVGAWLRDNYAIYRLNCGKPQITLPDSELTLSKCALKGPSMDHYFKPNDFFRMLRPPIWKQDPNAPAPTEPTKIAEVLSPNGEIPELEPVVLPSEDDGICRDVICRDSDVFLNKYVVGAIDLLETYDNSTIIYPTLSNEQYDILLSQNIVFLNMWDAAAVNTLIECIVRNTPVLINKLPPIVEYLGENYPLYLDPLSPDDLSVLTYSNIVAAHTYLTNMNKNFLTAHFFMDSLTNGPIYSQL